MKAYLARVFFLYLASPIMIRHLVLAWMVLIFLFGVKIQVVMCMMLELFHLRTPLDQYLYPM